MQHIPSYQVNFQDVLEAKEKRAAFQRQLREEYHAPLMSITVNMPGSVKYNEDTVGLVYRVLDKVRPLIEAAGVILLEERFYHLSAGPTAILAFQGEAEIVKAIGISLEDSLPYGRLVDIDVFDDQGRQLSRGGLGIEQRKCFICSQMAVDCMRAGRHTHEETMAAARKLIELYRAEQVKVWSGAVEIIAQTALEAMMAEVACTPAPGLVDRHNSGAHQDMDFFSFILSSSAISPAMYQCAAAGWEHRGEPEGVLAVLRTIGSEAETKMFAATRGVNTQKGLLFLMGVMTAATAMVLRKHGSSSMDQILTAAAGICRGIVERELSALRNAGPEKKLTAGERLYLNHGITGIRGEVEAGLPVIAACGIPALKQALGAGLSLNDSLVHALMALITETQDTTILNRHDISMLVYVRQEAQAAIDAGGMLTEQGRIRILELDELFISKNISPGGSADLLAVTYFLYRMETIFKVKGGDV